MLSSGSTAEILKDAVLSLKMDRTADEPRAVPFNKVFIAVSWVKATELYESVTGSHQLRTGAVVKLIKALSKIPQSGHLHCGAFCPECLPGAGRTIQDHLTLSREHVL
jgi:hypothetical protein